jgi:hypothetical protein
MSTSRVRLEVPVKFKSKDKTILKGSIFHLNIKNGYYELKIRNEIIASISRDTIDKFPDLTKEIEDE